MGTRHRENHRHTQGDEEGSFFLSSEKALARKTRDSSLLSRGEPLFRRRRRRRRSVFLRRVASSILEEKGNPSASDASNNKERNERDTLPREVRQTSRATPPPPPRVQPFYAALRGCQNLWNRFHVEQQIVSQKRRRPLRKTEKCRCFR